MIKGVTRIKGFGIFDNYTKPVGIEPFAERNIIYGWNYSGKTTFSRLFHCLESKALHEDYPDAEFTVEADGTLPITQDNLHTDTKSVRVFNSDFVAKNLSWDGNTFAPILLLGEESIEIEKKIEIEKSRLEKCRDGYKRKTKSTRDLEVEVADKKRAAASQIKTTLSIVEAFNATHLDKLLIGINAVGVEAFLLNTQQVQDMLKLALASEKDKLDLVTRVELQPSMKSLEESCKGILAKTPVFSSAIEYLRDNPEVANWVELGLPLHRDKGSCEFCGNKLDSERMGLLQAHFSKDLTTFRNELQGAVEKVRSSKLLYEEKGKGLFYPEFKNAAAEAGVLLKQAVFSFNSALEKLEAALQQKLSAPFESFECPVISDQLDAMVLDALNELNRIIDQTNEITTHYGDEKKTAIDFLKNHYAAEFSVRENLPLLEKRKAIYFRHQNIYQSCGEKSKSNIAVLEAKISQAQKGREYMNGLIADLLGGNSVQIRVVSDGVKDRFQLARGDYVAKNLSEGEKTAIAFSFFLSKLREEKELENVIVYIDDPISSLDSNHIFQVNAMIRGIFLYKDGEKWKTSCKQLFISTHNFEFLSLLKELPGQKGRQNYYHIRRNTQITSTLTNLSGAIIKFPSEYHYLYSLIRDFHNSPDKGNVELLLSIPNAVRRFVEIYTMARLPTKEEVDVRAESLFGATKAKRILKVLHYFSHLNNIDRLVKNTDLICDIENAVSDLLALIKADDPRHLEALENAVA